MMTASENQWVAHAFHDAIAHSARELLGNVEATPIALEAARRRVMEHWLAQVAPAGVG